MRAGPELQSIPIFTRPMKEAVEFHMMRALRPCCNHVYPFLCIARIIGVQCLVAVSVTSPRRQEVMQRDGVFSSDQ
jgi:hypothetical protein